MRDIVEQLRDADFGWSGDASCVSAEVAEQGALEIERLRAERDALVLVIMRGSHREARDLARPRFVEMHPEEKGHAAKLARINQQSTPHK